MSRASKFYQFKSKQSIDNNMNEPLSKLKYHGLYPNRTTVIVEDWMEQLKKTRKIDRLQYVIFQELQWQMWNIIQ